MGKNNYNTKENPENSSVIQALLDIRDSGAYPALDINHIISSLRADQDAFKQAEKLFHSHLYPDHKLTFCKLECEVEVARFLSTNALVILIAMCQNMRHKNLIQLRHRDILTITSIKSLRSVGPALKELSDCGCIATKIQGTTRRATVYMVNPLIATVGSPAPYLVKQFWKLTGTKYIDKTVKYSIIHRTWNHLTAERTYSKGYSSLETESDDKPVYFSRINEPKIKTKKKKSAGTENPDENTIPEPEDGIDESLPFADE